MLVLILSSLENEERERKEVKQYWKSQPALLGYYLFQKGKRKVLGVTQSQAEPNPWHQKEDTKKKKKKEKRETHAT